MRAKAAGARRGPGAAALAALVGSVIGCVAGEPSGPAGQGGNSTGGNAGTGAGGIGNGGGGTGGVAVTGATLSARVDDVAMTFLTQVLCEYQDVGDGTAVIGAVYRAANGDRFSVHIYSPFNVGSSYNCLSDRLTLHFDDAAGTWEAQNLPGQVCIGTLTSYGGATVGSRVGMTFLGTVMGVQNNIFGQTKQVTDGVFECVISTLL